MKRYHFFVNVSSLFFLRSSANTQRTLWHFNALIHLSHQRQRSFAQRSRVETYSIERSYDVGFDQQRVSASVSSTHLNHCFLQCQERAGLVLSHGDLHRHHQSVNGVGEGNQDESRETNGELVATFSSLWVRTCTVSALRYVSCAPCLQVGIMVDSAISTASSDIEQSERRPTGIIRCVCGRNMI